MCYAARTRPFEYVIAECLADLGVSHAAYLRHKRRATEGKKFTGPVSPSLPSPSCRRTGSALLILPTSHSLSFGLLTVCFCIFRSSQP